MTLGPNVYDAEPIPEAARAEIDRLLQSGDLFRYTAPQDAPVALLEREFADMMGAKYALAVASCSAALFISLKALGLPRDTKVLIPAFTFAAVPSSVVHADCVPVLVDVMDNYRVNMDDFETKLTDDVGAVIISHMRGHTSDMDAIMALCDAKGIPVVEDAAHSLGTLWHGEKIGKIGKIGCFSFQSYKMLNAGEGGILITDDADIIARAVIMSGAYEHNWKKHKGPHGDNTTELEEAFGRWQNKLPLYNTRLSNLSAAVIRPQIPELERRVTDGLRNHDYVAAKLNESPWIDVPAPLAAETRAPDSIQFNLVDMTDDETRAFMDAAKVRGVSVQVFGMHTDNARAFWNWEFIGDQGPLPGTKKMLMRACDTRLPVRLKKPELDFIANALVAAAADVKEAASASVAAQ
ncbi:MULTISPECIES: aminotransferase class I/II-fold pyridoxal phosphate-dependent enzyme [Maritimibacter]|uniref:Aminotransferase, DegT/DnrJ/EryC1/StrS family protein n=1 Tax=Maritimibacter alkaliphilus HTCC2654 TaxID=314271 RepID=A3VMB7_9RHOB|nr:MULTISPECIES: aminotransferase class I/II-fold pyridoxal phosphate-dependent enzyme [Maritimibacter]EAQ10575.1 aminotransferase, DegT/DnrJ/EryC1/StrS family protein [Rhodobacterales bacterium HTCC2654] [Maritimibacter alkaliphilus HTCC2654]MBL6429239.1 aminotransferase class I/II-fold pyridoxal phosphate-dependent enzyme [Maritimibacter sp.]TYP81738.1 dTDP-4-amino-4,6-dideoxygalactose transaminase [Maritimibacter alkaliphilus HTCC2654]